MQMDADDLLTQMRQDWPTQYELSSLRLLTARQAAEIDRLTALTPQPVFGRTYRQEQEADGGGL